MIKKKYKLRIHADSSREVVIEAPNQEIAKQYAQAKTLDITLLDEWRLDVKQVIIEPDYIEKTDEPADIEMDEQWLDKNYECSYTQRESKDRLKVVA